jgi:hypothetical protein
MLGLPTETFDDIEGIVDLVHKIRNVGRKGGRRPLQIRVSCSTFVPKPHTPFQWVAQNTKEELGHKYQVLKQGLKRIGANLSWQDPEMSEVEGILARGDRRLAKVICRAWQLGCIFDAWSEHFDYQKWRQAFSDCGLDPHFYAHRQRPLNEVLPWSHIDSGVSLEFLKREYERTEVAQETPDCRQGRCVGCGLERWDGGCQRKYHVAEFNSTHI